MSEVTREHGGMKQRRFKPYPAYKDSSVEWLGAIPEHWKVESLKRNVQFLEGPGIMAGDFVSDGIPLLRISGIGEQIATLDGCNYLSPALVNKKWQHFRVRSGDLLISGSASTGFCAEVDEKTEGAVPYTGIIIIRPRIQKTEKEFLRWFFLSGAFLTQTELARSGSAIQHFGPSHLSRMHIILPLLSEQLAIAAFLDKETAKIDALVAKNERLIELLQGERTALIAQAVTRGLDPNVPMKDSGIEWLGEIPAHWGVKPLKHIAEFVNGFAFKQDEWGIEGTPIIRIENLNGGDNFNCTTRELPRKYCADKGDLLFGWSGNRGTSFGPFFWWRAGKHYVNQHIFRIINFETDKRWLYWTLRAVTFYVEKQAHGIIGMVHITKDELGAISIPIVPRAEQEEIGQYLDHEHARLDAIEIRIRNAIGFLKEYRIALISAVVTGKIDVREEGA